MRSTSRTTAMDLSNALNRLIRNTVQQQVSSAANSLLDALQTSLQDSGEVATPEDGRERSPSRSPLVQDAGQQTARRQA